MLKHHIEYYCDQSEFNRVVEYNSVVWDWLPNAPQFNLISPLWNFENILRNWWCWSKSLSLKRRFCFSQFWWGPKNYWIQVYICWYWSVLIALTWIFSFLLLDFSKLFYSVNHDLLSLKSFATSFTFVKLQSVLLKHTWRDV